MSAPTDADLLGRYLHDRDDTAFAAIVRKHGPMVFGACRRVTAHHHDAEDAFQAAFLVLAARAEVVRPKERLGAWLHGVAVRCARKARDARRRLGSSDSLPEPAVLPPAAEPDLLAQIDDALAAIPETYRAAVVLCHLEGRSRGEAARELGWSEGTLSGRLHRALDLLGRRLAARGVAATSAAVLAVWSARTASANVPAALSESTSSAASLLTAGFDQPAGSAASLAHGVMRAMSFRKLKLAAAVLVGVMGVGSFAVMNTAEAKPTGERVTRKNAPVPEKKWRVVFSVKHDHPVSAVATRGVRMLTGDDRGGIVCWDATTGKQVQLLMTADGKAGKPVRWVAVSDDEAAVTTISADGTSLMVCDVATGGGHGFTDKYLLALSADAHSWILRDDPFPAVTVKFNAFQSQFLKKKLAKGHRAYFEDPDKKAITHAALSAEGLTYAVVNADGITRVFDRTENTEQSKITLALADGLKLTALKLSDDGKRLAVIGEKGFARVFDAEAGKELCELKGHDGTVNAVAFTPDGSQVATANGKVVRVFDAKNGKLLDEIKGHDDEVTCLAFAADGKRLVTGSKDKTAKVWEVK